MTEEKAVWRKNKEEEFNQLKGAFRELEEQTKKDFSGKVIKRGNISYIFELIKRNLFSKKMIAELKDNWRIIQINNEKIWRFEKEVEYLRKRLDELEKI